MRRRRPRLPSLGAPGRRLSLRLLGAPSRRLRLPSLGAPRRWHRRFFTALRHRGPTEAPFDGRRFSNLVPTETWSGRVMKWMLTRKPEPWPRWVSGDGEPVFPPPPARVEGSELRVTLVNHSTVLIQTAGLNLLTDPVWSMRVGPFPWLGATRVRLPGVAFDDLPKIDAVLLSHDHYDHLDMPTMKRLARRDRPRIFTGLGVDRTLEIDGLAGAEALDWGQTRDLGALGITFLPARHFSGRGLKDQNSTLWGSFAVTSPAGVVYFAGDTGFGPHFAEARARLGEIAVALLPIGCYEPRWFMAPFHMSPEDAVRAHVDLGARVSIGIHHGTFRLGDEALDRPARDLAAALAAAGLAPEDFRAPPFGAALTISARPRQRIVVSPSISW